MNHPEILFWYWWVLAVGLLAIEILLASFFFLWLAISAFLVGLLALLIASTGFDVQILLFSVLAVFSVLAWRRFARTMKIGYSDHPLLNRRGEQYIGSTFTLIEAIANGQGKIKVGDSIWTVQGEDCQSGGKVRVVGVKGTVLVTEKCD